ncbi:MAG: ABC transporter permease subunit [Acidobacteria bacterium]|nr:ABC transporter permease subunit [Acidobacteriota bacterium]
MRFIGCVVCMAAFATGGCAAPEGLVVGSKAFTEGIVLGELVRLRASDYGVPARHERQLGGTRVLWNALLAGEIDAYVDYTGTIAQEILGGAVGADPVSLREALSDMGVGMSDPLGFGNTYALGMLRERASQLGINSITDLANHPLQFGFSTEFMDRPDGWPGVRDRYRLAPESVTGLDHDLAYRALAAGELDVTDLYTTDAEIRAFDLVALEDDRAFFPDYRAVVLYGVTAASTEGFRSALVDLEGAIDAAAMIAMNAAVRLDGRGEEVAAAEFLSDRFGTAVTAVDDSAGERIASRTMEHLWLVAVSLFAAMALAIPAGLWAAHRPRLGALVLGVGGIVQTIPSLALLVFLVPVLGIGAPPAITALFLYSLLPILRNTVTGVTTISPHLLESADALGLSPSARLRLVELPLASPSILAGIKTAAVINVGTATLGALIGAGGYGQPILTGIRLADTALILEGAIPAAALALVAQGLFGGVEKIVVPRGLRL